MDASTIREALRLSSTDFDATEITPLIEACKIDLKSAGVTDTRIAGEDALIQHAITLYVKANFGYEENYDRFAKAYEQLKISLALAGDIESQA